MTSRTSKEIAAKADRIKSLGDALLAELLDGADYGLGREFAVAKTNVETALLWAVVGLRGAVEVAADQTASGEP